MYNVAIIGAGPAGIFAALEIMKLKPEWKVVLIEKGQRIEKRKCPIREGSPKCVNCKRCGLLCGWGGAGAFSDGKLNTGVKDSRSRKVLQEFVNCGAPEDILYTTKPHIGTDKLKTTVKNLRKKIISLGAKINF